MEKKVNKGGRPKGSMAYRGTLGIPKHMITKELVKALKQFERVSDDDPKKIVKRGQAIRKIMDVIVEKAIDGNMEAISYITDRTEGKAVNRTETQHEVNGQVEHTGFKVTFEAPKEVKGETLEHKEH